MNPSNNNELNPNNIEAQEALDNSNTKKDLVTLETGMKLVALRDEIQETNRQTILEKDPKQMTDKELIDTAKFFGLNPPEYNIDSIVNKTRLRIAIDRRRSEERTKKLEEEIKASKEEIKASKEEIKASEERTKIHNENSRKGMEKMQKNVKEM